MTQKPNNDEFQQHTAPLVKQADQIESPLYQLLYRKAPYGIFILNDMNRIVDANAAACTLLGYEKKFLVGMNFTSLIHPRNRDDIPLLTRHKILKTPLEAPLEHLYKKADKSYIQVLVTPRAMADPPALVMMFQDISAQKKTQTALQESELKYKTLFKNTGEALKTKQTLEEQLLFFQTLIDTIPSPIFYKDDAGLYMGCNRAFETYIGLSRDELVGKSVYDVAPKHLADIYRKADEDLLRKKETQIYEASVKYADGSVHDVVFNKAVFSNKDGIATGMVGVMLDITEKKEAENEKKELLNKLYQAQKLEAIGNLSAGIAHDFNNILSGILGSSQLAKLHTKNSQKINNELDKIIKGAHRAADLVQQILTFSRRSEYKKQPLKLFILVKEALKLIRATIPSTIEIKEKIDSKAVIMADPGRIHQVIMNLCTNAYHAMGETGGVLTVGTREIQISERGSIPGPNLLPGNYLVLEVSDTGRGIHPKDMDKIFDPYFTRKTPDSGTGLGLSVVHGIVEEHSGYIKVSSKLGQGSVFQVFIPVTEEQVESKTQEETHISTLFGTEKIMIVDDEEYILNSTKGILEDFGYTPISFSNGVEALEAFNKDPQGFDLIITDRTMPGMTGNELAAKIFETRPELPIILCSGYSPKTTMDKAEKLGIKRFLQKPVNLEDLTMMVREMLDQNETP